MRKALVLATLLPACLWAADPSPNAVVQDGAWGQQIILGAANTAGRFGSYFRTDVFVNNPNNFQISLTFAALTASGLHPTTFRWTMPANTYSQIDDILGRMSYVGGAALIITPENSNHQFNAWAYTYTAGPNGGTYGVNLLAVGNAYLGNKSGFVNFPQGMCVGAAQNANYRTNVGLANATNSAAVVRVRLYGPNGLLGERLATVPAFSAVQFPVTDLSSASFALGYLDFTVASTASRVLAFMVVNDNVTNDANFQLVSTYAGIAVP